MTPLIDVLFILLIFFILSYKPYQPYKQIKTQSYQMNLPKSNLDQTFKSKKPIVISILPNQNILFQNQKVSLQKLSSQLKPLISKKPKTPIILKADKNTKLQTMVSVFDVIQKSGAQQMPFLYTQPNK